MIRRVAPLLALTLLIGGGSSGPRQLDPGFRASVILERRAPGALPRVRFEWTPVAGAVEYLLMGNWTAGDSWTVQRGTFRVTRQTASSWTADRVTFEVSLLPGDHSWRLAPVRRPNGDPEQAAAQVGFQLR